MKAIRFLGETLQLSERDVFIAKSVYAPGEGGGTPSGWELGTLIREQFNF